MTPTEFISQQAADRQALMTALHESIIANDTTVAPIIEPMMGKEMIIYKEGGKVMKYALASVQKYMSLHCLPMYMNPVLHGRYEPLLPKAKFQKGCINFISADELPVDIAAALIKDCSAISITALLEARNKKKK